MGAVDGGGKKTPSLRVGVTENKNEKIKKSLNYEAYPNLFVKEKKLSNYILYGSLLQRWV